MNVLLATNHLENVGGTEKYTYALAEELLRRGADVEYATYRPGPIAKRLEADLGLRRRKRQRYDLVLANHWPVVDEVSRFGLTVQTVHGIFPELERPSDRANGFVAVSVEVQERLAHYGFPSVIVPNGINLDTHRSTRPLPSKLSVVLSMVHTDRANGIAREACDLLGVELHVLSKYRHRRWDVVTPINDADLVIGVGRTAYEAMACERPVVAFDWRQYTSNLSDGYLPHVLPYALAANCSGRWAKRELDAAGLASELAKYDASDGPRARAFAEAHLNIRSAVDKYLAYGQELEDRPFRRVRRWQNGQRLRRAVGRALGRGPRL